MEPSQEAMQVALRVLRAMNNQKLADRAAVARLLSLEPFLADAPLDEIACDVIQWGLKCRQPGARASRALELHHGQLAAPDEQ